MLKVLLRCFSHNFLLSTNGRNKSKMWNPTDEEWLLIYQKIRLGAYTTAYNRKVKKYGRLYKWFNTSPDSFQHQVITPEEIGYFINASIEKNTYIGINEMSQFWN